MLDETQKLPDDPAELRSAAKRLVSLAKAQALRIAKLEHQLAGLRRQRFGSTSETLEQLDLALEETEIEVARAADPAAAENAGEIKRKPRRKPLPKELPRHETVLMPGESCNGCGGRLKSLGEDVTEELEYIPGRFVVNRFVRPRLACACCEAIVQAPLPTRPPMLPKLGAAGRGLASWRTCWSASTGTTCRSIANRRSSSATESTWTVPLWRPSRACWPCLLRRSDDWPPGQSWVGKSTALLEPLANAIGRHVLAGQAIFADDTPIKLQAPGNGKTKTARIWTYVRDERPWLGPDPPAVRYEFTIDRKGQHPANHLAGYRGWVHAPLRGLLTSAASQMGLPGLLAGKGYSGFNELYRSGTSREVACLAHIRRKFVDIVQSQTSPIAEEAIKRIAGLYAVEKQARGQPPEIRVQLRQAHARSILDALEAWLEAQLPRISGKSELAKASRYALSRLKKLRPYLDHGCLEADNNCAERAMKSVALGRKNYLFVGSDGGGKATAIAYTLVETAKLNGINPQAWLTNILSRIADHKINKIDELLPWTWAASRADATSTQKAA